VTNSIFILFDLGYKDNTIIFQFQIIVVNVLLKEFQKTEDLLRSRSSSKSIQCNTLRTLDKILSSEDLVEDGEWARKRGRLV
jgi:hypothetical protein